MGESGVNFSWGSRRPVGDAPFARDPRFQDDELPGPTWTICRHHGTVQTTDERGTPIVGGMCEQCRAEIASGRYFSCPQHGIQPKVPGNDRCPFPGCLGESTDPSFEEVERVAAQIRADWAREDAALKAHLDAQVPGPADVGGGAPREGGAHEPGSVPRPDPQVRVAAARAVEQPAAVKLDLRVGSLAPGERVLAAHVIFDAKGNPVGLVPPGAKYEIVPDDDAPEPWRDPFLEP